MARVGLALAGIGVLMIVLDLFGLAIVGVIAVVVGTALALPFGWGEKWCYAVVAGAILSVLARLIAGPHQTLGGLLAVVAALAILVGAPLGYPADEE